MALSPRRRTRGYPRLAWVVASCLLYLWTHTTYAQSTGQYHFFTAGNVPGSTYTTPLATSRIQIVGDYQLPAAGTPTFRQRDPSKQQNPQAVLPHTCPA